MTLSKDNLKIALALESLIGDKIIETELAMMVLKIPPPLCAAMWEVMARRAMAKIIKCEKAPK